MSKRPDRPITLSLSVPESDTRLDSLMGELSKKQLTIVSSGEQTQYFFVEGYSRRGAAATVTCSREALPYLEQSLRAHRFAYTVQAGD